MIAALAVSAFLVGVHIAVSLFLKEPWFSRLLLTAEYAVPCGLAMLLFGVVSWKSGRLVRVGTAIGVSLLMLASLFVGGATLAIVRFFFLFFLPLWVVLGVTGTGHYRWSFLQWTGATIIAVAAWMPLYGSFPALTQLATASGKLEAYSVFELYTIVTQKLLHETFLIVAGLLLLVVRFPVAQKRPERGDWQATLRAIGGARRYNAALTWGLGASTFMVAFFGSIALQSLLENSPIGQTGADESSVFERMTPVLVVLLSFAAGAGEELIFRGVLQPAFERVFRRMMPPMGAAVAAIVAQAILFGVVHAGYGNLVHVLLPFAFGLLTGVAYRLWGLLPTVYAHFMIDVFAFGVEASTRFPWLDVALYVVLLINLLAGIAAPLWFAVDHFFLRRQRALAQPAEIP